MLVVWFPQEQFYNSPISIAPSICTAWNSTIYKLVSVLQNVLSLCPKSGIFVPKILKIVNLFGILTILYVTQNLVGIKSGLLGRGMGTWHSSTTSCMCCLVQHQVTCFVIQWCYLQCSIFFRSLNTSPLNPRTARFEVLTLGVTFCHWASSTWSFIGWLLIFLMIN